MTRFRRSTVNFGLVLLALLCCGTLADAQGRRGGGPGDFGIPGGIPGGFRGFGGMGAGPTQLLARPDVQKELKLTSSQIDELDQVSNEMRRERANRMREQFGGGGGNRGAQSPEDRQDMFTRIREAMEKQRSEEKEKVLAILNSSQQSRFAELEFQFQLQQGSAEAALASAGVELSESDRKKFQESQGKLQEERRRIQEEASQKIRQLQQDANMEFLESVLGSSKLRRLMGDEFAFETMRTPAFRPGRPRGGGDEAGRNTGEDSDDSGQSSRRRRRGR